MRTKIKFVSLVALVSFAMAVIRTVIIQYDMEKNGIENETYYLPDNTTAWHEVLLTEFDA